MANTPTTVQPRLSRTLRNVVTALSLVGFAGFLLTLLVGFETPNSVLLRISSWMAMSAPVVVVVHLLSTKNLTDEKKRVWWRELTSQEMFSALAEYLSSADLSAAADRRAINVARRSGVKNETGIQDGRLRC